MDTVLDLVHIRAQYRGSPLLEAKRNPTQLLEQWLQEAISAGIVEPNAMTLATVADGHPRARVVLLRGLDQSGLTFFTNYSSDKGSELNTNPNASLSFLWAEVARQVRVEGVVARVSDAESDAYFATRPRGHQLGAWASQQSKVIASRAVLEQQEAETAARFPGAVPRPPFWGGYRLTPSLFEFWQGRENRLHDRLRYTLSDGAWHEERLSP